MKIWIAFFSVLVAFVVLGCLERSSVQVGNESDHGIVFPGSVRNFQNFGDSTSRRQDRGIATLFEMKEDELDKFLDQLKIQDRHAPVRKAGDPRVNGWNVWPEDAQTFVPGNDEYGGFNKTWKGEATPQRMLSCKSAVGDWFHVEIWKLSEGKVLLKVYTDWN